MSIKSVTLTLNGEMYALEKNSSTGKYSKVLTAPAKSSYNLADKVYPMELKATDEAGNVTTINTSDEAFGSLLKLRVNEKTPPIISIQSPADNAYLTNNSLQIQFTVTDTDSGVDRDSICMLIDGTEKNATITSTTNGYKCTYTATLSDGSHTIKITASDNDGNEAIVKEIAFKVDTLPPELSILSPATELITNEQVCTVSGTTNDATSSPCIVQILLNGAEQGNVEVNADGTFSKSVTLVKGTNTVKITSTDQAGKASEVERNVVYDPDAPIVISFNAQPNPVDVGDTFTVTVEVSD